MKVKVWVTNLHKTELRTTMGERLQQFEQHARDRHLPLVSILRLVEEYRSLFE